MTVRRNDTVHRGRCTSFNTVKMKLKMKQTRGMACVYGGIIHTNCDSRVSLTHDKWDTSD